MITHEIESRPANLETFQNPEKRLSGKTAVLTGGSRDIGAGIARALAKEGVKIVASYHEKKKRADAVEFDITQNGGDISFIEGDLSNQEGRIKFARESLDKLSSVDYLILSTSGDTQNLNEDLSEDMIQNILPHMNKDGVVVRLQSVPGRYAPQLQGLGKMVSIYDDVAAHKYKDLQNLRGKIEEVSGRGVRFVEITPPVVKERVDGKEKDTSNMMLFNMVAKKEAKEQGKAVKSAEEMHNEICDKLGLPRVKFTDEIGEEIVNIILNPEIPTGYIELFGKVKDAQTLLENWYDTGRVYVQTVEKTESYGNQKKGIGRSIVSREQALKTEDPKMLDQVAMDSNGYYYGKLLVTPNHAKGHLDPEKGFPLIFPGHKQIRSALDCIAEIEKSLGNGNSVLLENFDIASFKTPVKADGKTVLTVYPKCIERMDHKARYNVEIINDQEEVTTLIENLEVVCLQDDKLPLGILPDQFIEGAAQAAGAVLLDEVTSDTMPLFMKVGPVKFEGILIAAGGGVEYRVEGKGSKAGINGSVEVYSHNTKIGQIDGIRALVSDKREVMKRLEVSV